MAEPTPTGPSAATEPLRIGVAVFVALAAAALLFAAGMMVGDDRDMHRGDFGSRGMMGGQEMMGGQGMMGGSNTMGGMGMMGAMNVSSEREFLTEMIPHHEEAIESARILKEGSDRKEMRDFADEIITTQQAEVDDMREYLDRWHDGARPADDYQPMMRDDLDELSGDDLDRAFLQDMPMHHMMAVHMSRSLLGSDLAEHDEVTELASSIDVTQRREIGQMYDWMGEWFGDDAGSGGGMPMMGRQR